MTDAEFSKVEINFLTGVESNWCVVRWGRSQYSSGKTNFSTIRLVYFRSLVVHFICSRGGEMILDPETPKQTVGAALASMDLPKGFV